MGILEIVTPEKLEKHKKHFKVMFTKWREKDKEYCHKNGIESPIQDDDYIRILGMVDKCENAYEFDALGKIIFQLNGLPDNMQQIKDFAEYLRNLY